MQVAALAPVEAVDLLDGGAEAFPRMLAAIAAAERWVHLEVYTFSDEGVGRQFMDALGAAARRGVTVNVVIDGWGSATTGRSVKAQLEAEGVHVDIFHPLRTLFLGRFRRNHRKMLVVDDLVAYIGGINIGDEYQNTALRVGWADLALEIRGPAVAGLGRRIRREPAAPRAEGSAAVQIYLSGWGGAWRLRGRYLRQLRDARARIALAHGYFLPDRKLVRAILEAVRRGVDVRILLSGRSDVPFAKAAMSRLYHQFITSGVKIFEWTHSVLHAKAAVIDGRVTMVGSFNLDPFSLRNFETLVEVDDVDIASDTEGWITQRVTEARAVTLADCNPSSFRWWLVDRIGLVGARLASFFGALMGTGPRHWP